MSSHCNSSQPLYLRALLQLLPRGYAWDWDENSYGRRVLAVAAAELQRVHEFYCGLGNYNVERFSDRFFGWSAPDYERLLHEKFAVKSPYVRDNDYWAFPRLAADPRQKYIFRIRSRSAISSATQQYLNVYQQSHTDHHITRDLQSNVTVFAAVSLHNTWTMRVKIP